jgi:hypothetical protein
MTGLSYTFYICHAHARAARGGPAGLPSLRLWIGLHDARGRRDKA